MKMKKNLVGIIAILLLSLVMVACSASDEDKQDVTDSTQGEDVEDSGDSSEAKKFDGITINWLSQGPGETGWEISTQPLIEKFEEETGATVNAEFYAFNDYFEIMEVKLGSGSDDYDVLSVDVPMVAPYVDRGYLLPMDEYYTEEELDQFIDSAVTAGTWEGSFYCPPMNTSSQLVWYNQALIDEAGVTIPETGPDNRITWDELKDIANQVLDVVDPDRNQGFAGIMFQQVSRTYQMNALPNSMGGKSIGDDGLTVDGVINSDEWIDALTWYQGLYEDKTSLRGITGDETNELFQSGKIIFMVGGPWTAQFAEDADMDYGVMYMPAFEGYEDSVATSTGSWHFGLPKNIKEENLECAVEFIKYLTLGEGNEMWIEVRNDIPSTIEGLNAITENPDSPEFMNIAAYEAEHTAYPRALTPGYTEYDSAIATMWEDVRNGSDVEAALNSAVDQIETALSRYK